MVQQKVVIDCCLIVAGTHYLCHAFPVQARPVSQIWLGGESPCLLSLLIQTPAPGLAGQIKVLSCFPHSARTMPQICLDKENRQII